MSTSKRCADCGSWLEPDALGRTHLRKRCLGCKAIFERERLRLCAERKRKRDPQLKAREYRIRRLKQGKAYTPRHEITRRSRDKEERRKAAALARRSMTNTSWVNRLRSERPDLYDGSKTIGALAWLARYNLDPEFKARELERSARRRAKEHGDGLMSDGTLTGPVVQSLFASTQRCPYCDKVMNAREKQGDHIVSKHAGGWHSAANFIVCCASCNCSKADRSPEQWLSKLSPSIRPSVIRLWDRVSSGSWRSGWLKAS